MKRFTLGHQTFEFHDNIDNVHVQETEDALNITWSQGVNTNITTPWHIEARVLASKDRIIFSIQQVILYEPMSDSFSAAEEETGQFLPMIESILQQKAA
jgi:hypothetical protein